ncbi:MAG: [LysW]-lysine hydrolase [Planctomycetes bacterium]|nr:[LysW]-lysine hydrolase [Planctomycetota bacterium]
MALDRAYAEQLLEDMVRTESLSGEEQAVAALIVERMKALGYDSAEVDGAGNAVGHLGSGPRRLVLLGHMDTVPGEVPIRREGDLLYGRGSVDAKGPLATFIAAASLAGAAPDWTITVVGVVEEEAASSKGARFVAPLWRPEACVIGEPSGHDAVTLGYKGRLVCEYRYAQGTSHSAGPLPSAGQIGVAFVNAAQAAADELNVGQKRVFDQISPNLLSIHSENDGLEESVTLTISWRVPLWFERESWEAGLRAVASGLDEEEGSHELRFYGSEVAYKGTKNNPLVKAFLAAIRSQELKPRFKVKTGTADLNILGPVWECPILAYGPGDSSLDHTPNEHISLDEYWSGVQILREAVQRLTQG